MTHAFTTRRLRDLALLGGLTLGLAAPVALAQDAGPRDRPARIDRGERDAAARGAHAHRARHRHGRAVARALDLTPAQREAIRAIRADARSERAAIREAFAPGSDEARAARRQLREGTRAAMRDVLTPAQQAKLGALRAERGERSDRGEARGPRSR